MTAAARSVLLVAAIQFVYILDFIMVLPLGPDLAAALGFPAERVGLLTAAYTLASVAAGLAGLRLLDRFERKRVLLCAFGLLALATVATCLATDLATLLAARAVTGLVGAPAIATGMALVIDLTPPTQRGRVIAKVMLGFSLAAIAGVPAALELARIGGWRLPFMALGLLALGIWLLAAALLPASGAHLARRELRGLLSSGTVRAACVVQGLSQFSAFLLIPHFSAYYLLNLGFPRDRLGLLYLAGGLVALVAVQLLGRLADRSGPRMAVAIASSGMAIGLLPFFAGSSAGLPLMVMCFVAFMAGNAGRNVSLGAALSQVPEPQQRASFMALQNMVQDIAIAAAALAGSALLAQDAGGRLNGMALLAACAMAVGCAVPWALARLSDQEGYCRTTS